MSRPVNPYVGRIEHENTMDTLGSWAPSPPQLPVPEPAGVAATDLHNIAIRNYRLGHRNGFGDGAQERQRLEDERREAWDAGLLAGERCADERAGVHVEGCLRLMRGRLAAPARKAGTPTEMQTRINTVEQLIEGALSIFAEDKMSTVDEEDAAEASGFTVKGFAQLEKVLIEAAEREGSHEIGDEQDG